MSNIKKFLDQIGVTHLWNKVEENFPNNEELAIIVNAIDETKADKTDLVGKKVSNGEVFNDYTNNTATGDYSHAEGYKTQATGKSAHAEGTNTKAIGDYSHAEGNKSYANGKYSHAEGQMTNANGDYSHAEGRETNAGIHSHAEGTNTKAEASSHAEGTSTIALNNSHAEGIGGISSIAISGEANAKTYTLNTGGLRLNLMQGRVVYYNGIYAKVISTYSDGNGLLQFTLDKSLSREALSSVTAQLLFGVSYSDYSHVENKDNVASGTCSHAEGNRTVAAGMNQHVQGKFNLVDLEDKYAHIVGNGANWQNPSNAHTLDWNGNAWFAGDVRVGGTGDTDTNSFSIIPKTSTITLPSSSWNITTLQQEVAVTGISADQTSQIITISPDTSCYTEYLDAGAICIGQAENSLTFSVEEIPSSDFIVYVAIQNCR